MDIKEIVELLSKFLDVKVLCECGKEYPLRSLIEITYDDFGRVYKCWNCHASDKFTLFKK